MTPYENSVVLSIAFSPNDNSIALGTLDGVVQTWNVASPRATPLSLPMRHAGAVKSVIFGKNGDMLLSASEDGTVRLWNLRTSAPAAPVIHHPAALRNAIFVDDERKIISVDTDSSVFVWSTQERQGAFKPIQSEVRINRAFLSPNGLRLATLDQNNVVVVRDLGNMSQLSSIQLGQNQMELAWSRDSSSFAVSEKSLRLWDAGTGHPRGPAIPPVQSPQLASPDRTIQAVTDQESDSNRLIDLRTGRAGPDFGKGMRTMIQFSPKGDMVSTAHELEAQLWKLDKKDLLSPSLISRPMQHADRVHSAHFSPDEKKVVTCSWDKTIRVWDLTGTPLTPALQHAAGVFVACFSPDGRYIAAGGEDRIIRVWDWEKGQPICPDLTVPDYAKDVVFTSDGRYVIVDNALPAEHYSHRVWSVVTGQPITPRVDGGTVFKDFQIATDLSRAVCIDYRGSVYVWDMESTDQQPDELIRQAERLSGSRMNAASTPIPLGPQWWKRIAGLESFEN